MEGVDINDKWPWKQMLALYLIGTFVVLIVLCLFLACGYAFAFEPDGNSYSRTQYEAKQRTLRKAVRHTAEPVTPVERHVLSKEDYEADPSILISKAADKPIVQVVEKVVYVERKPIIATISAEWGE